MFAVVSGTVSSVLNYSNTGVQNYNTFISSTASVERVSTSMAAASGSQYTVVYNVYFTPASAFTLLSNTLQTSVQKGTFTTTMQQIATQASVTALSTASSSTITIVSVTAPTQSPSKSPVSSTASSLSGGAIAGIVIGVLVFVGLCAGGLYYMYTVQAENKLDFEVWTRTSNSGMVQVNPAWGKSNEALSPLQPDAIPRTY